MPSAFRNTASNTTDDPIVAARTGMKIRVYSFYIWAGSAATNVTFNSKPAGAGTAISPLNAAGANGGGSMGYNPKGWFETNKGEGLSATTSNSGQPTGVLVSYDYLPA